jgi:ell wall binding domain 2 (CWB2)
MHTVPGSSARPLFVLLIALLLLCLLAGCGKSAGGDSSAEAASGGSTPAGETPTTLLGSAGAGGLSTPNTTRLGGQSPLENAAAVARAVYPGLTPSGRPQAVVIVDASDWPAALAASALASEPLRAPILYSEDGQLPGVSAAALAAMKPTGSRALGGAQVIAVGVAAPSGYKALSIGGASPYALAARIAGLLSRLQGGHVAAAILASATALAALSMPAAGLAAESGAPILLLGSKGVPSATLAALSRLRHPASYAIGPEAAISEATLTQLRRNGEATRIGTDGSIANAIKVAAFTNGHFGWGVDEPGHGLVFAPASQPLDAPASALLSATGDFAPLLLLGESSEGVPLDLERYLRDIQPGYGSSPESLPVRGVYNRGWLIGDQQAISVQTQSQLDALLRSVPRSSAPSQPSLAP